MIELEFFENGKRAFFPENLGECDTDQYIKMSRFIYLYQTGVIDEAQFLSLSVYGLLGIETTKKKQPSDEILEKRFENIAFLSKYVTKFFEEEEIDGKKGLKIKLDFTHNPIPKFKHRSITFEGPEDNFQNIGFGQYVKGLGLFMDYEQFREKETLVSLISIFYQNKNRLIPKKLKNLEDLDFGILYGFYLWFASFHKYISTGSIVYNGIEIDLSIIFSNDESDSFTSSLPGIGMKSILFDLAESGVFGTKVEVEKTDFWEIILRLYDLRKKAIDDKNKEPQPKPET